MAYLDSLEPSVIEVGYGELGRRGALGYDRRQVSVLGSPQPHALSAHAPSRLVFDIAGAWRSFHCRAAINEDVPPGCGHADFEVRVDGRVVAAAQRVRAGAPPAVLEAPVEGASRLELVADSDQLSFCHSVWVDAMLSEEAASPVDCLGRTEVETPAPPRPASSRCICTVSTSGFAPLLDDMLASLRMNGGVAEAAVVVLVVDGDADSSAVARRHGAAVLNCRSRHAFSPTIKSALYSVARAVDADQFLCLDADMLVLKPLDPLFAVLDACRDGSILVCADQNRATWPTLRDALVHLYRGTVIDITRLLGHTSVAPDFPIIVNDGMFAGSRTAMLALDSCIRSMRGASEWVERYWLRNQFIFNLALAATGMTVLADDSFNLQLHANSVEMSAHSGGVDARWHGKSVSVLHFNALGRNRYLEWRPHYAASLAVQGAHVAPT